MSEVMEAAIEWILTNHQIPNCLHSGGAYMTSNKKHHGRFRVVLGQRYKNAYNFIQKKCLKQTWLDILSCLPT